MTQFYTFVLALTCLFSLNGAYAFDNGTTPPDSTTSVVDRAAAVYFIEEGKTLFW